MQGSKEKKTMDVASDRARPKRAGIVRTTGPPTVDSNDLLSCVLSSFDLALSPRAMASLLRSVLPTAKTPNVIHGKLAKSSDSELR
jgi:hypothetical protein